MSWRLLWTINFDHIGLGDNMLNIERDSKYFFQWIYNHVTISDWAYTTCVISWNFFIKFAVLNHRISCQVMPTDHQGRSWVRSLERQTLSDDGLLHTTFQMKNNLIIFQSFIGICVLTMSQCPFKNASKKNNNYLNSKHTRGRAHLSKNISAQHDR